MKAVVIVDSECSQAQYQTGREKLSDYLRRLEQSLSRVVNHGGIEAHLVDRARVEQLLRGAVYSDMMLVQLKLRDRKETHPVL